MNSEMAWSQILVLLICITLVVSKDMVWQRPGCHKVGEFFVSI